MDASLIDRIPNELIVEVFKFLPFADRLTVRRVCSKWRSLSFQNIKEVSVMGRDLGGSIVTGSCIGCPLPLIQINNPDLKKRIDIFCTVLNESGLSLRNLCLGRTLTDNENLNELTELWKQMLDTLVIKCPNLVTLWLEGSTQSSSLSVVKHIFEPILIRLGSRLEQVYFSSFYPSLFSYLAIQHLNPNKLRQLGISVANEQQLSKLIIAFPDLTHLFLSMGSASNDSKLKLRPIRKLKNLIQLELHQKVDESQIKSLAKVSFAKTLRRLRLVVNPYVQGDAILNKNVLASLRVFTFLHKLILKFNIHFILKPIFKHLRLLEELDLHFVASEIDHLDDSDSSNKSDISFSSYDDLLNGLDLLKHLKKLKLCADGFPKSTSLDLTRLHPMPSVTSYNYSESSNDDSFNGYGGYGDYEEEEGFDYTSISFAFPNLIYLDVPLSCDHHQIYDLIECIDQLSSLKYLHVDSYGYWVQGIRNEMKPYCDQKNIHFLLD